MSTAQTENSEVPGDRIDLADLRKKRRDARAPMRARVRAIIKQLYGQEFSARDITDLLRDDDYLEAYRRPYDTVRFILHHFNDEGEIYVVKQGAQDSVDGRALRTLYQESSYNPERAKKTS